MVTPVVGWFFAAERGTETEVTMFCFEGGEINTATTLDRGPTGRVRRTSFSTAVSTYMGMDVFRQ